MRVASFRLGSLAFDASQAGHLASHRLGILGGSLLSALLGLFVLWKFLPRPEPQ